MDQPQTNEPRRVTPPPTPPKQKKLKVFPEGTINSRLFRAQEVLRKRIAELYQE